MKKWEYLDHELKKLKESQDELLEDKEEYEKRIISFRDENFFIAMRQKAYREGFQAGFFKGLEFKGIE